jgi:eukaryotic-like serine/threonine-protein kinase
MTDLIGKRLGDFEIVRELGRGGMGIVYEARQLSLNRKVALKVLAGLGLTSRALERFQREAEAAAQLHHTNIVPVYTTGEQDSTPFYAMELIDGESLDRVVRRLREPAVAGPPSDSNATGPYIVSTQAASLADASTSLSSGSEYFDNIARILADVADAVDHAHKNGVIHRDIKPSNLMLGRDGRLSVNDFGLARILEQPGMTVTGEFVGTPAYMSPEQIAAGRAPLDHRTDIYSLGATLYELLTLQRPFTGEHRDLVIGQIMHKEPRPPRKVNRKVPVDLETICLKAMEKDPDRRYQGAKDMSDDLRRFVNRFAIAAKNDVSRSMQERMQRSRPDKTTGAYWWPTHNTEGNKKRAEFCRTMALKARSGLLKEE